MIKWHGKRQSPLLDFGLGGGVLGESLYREILLEGATMSLHELRVPSPQPGGVAVNLSWPDGQEKVSFWAWGPDSGACYSVGTPRPDGYFDYAWVRPVHECLLVGPMAWRVLQALGATNERVPILPPREYREILARAEQREQEFLRGIAPLLRQRGITDIQDPNQWGRGKFRRWCRNTADRCRQTASARKKAQEDVW